MAKEYLCPACKNAVDHGATVCSNPVCRVQLALCSQCRDITTYTLIEKGEGRFERDRYRCDRCEQYGVKCVTWLAGGYCNGLARAAGPEEKKKTDMPLCASCNGRVGEVGRSVVSWGLIGALGGLFRRKK